MGPAHKVLLYHPDLEFVSSGAVVRHWRPIHHQPLLRERSVSGIGDKFLGYFDDSLRRSRFDAARRVLDTLARGHLSNGHVLARGMPVFVEVRAFCHFW